MIDIAPRLAALRRRITDAALDGFLVPHSDEYQNEYLPVSGERLAWISGFTGSAGMAIILDQRAALFIDGRYTLQAPAEVDGGLFEFRHLIEQPPELFMEAELKAGQRIGYDPWCLTPQQRDRLSRAAEKSGARLVAVSPSPLDLAWGADRPPVPQAPARPHGIAFSGLTHADKRRRFADILDQQGSDALIVSAQDSLAWLLDIRGGDVPHTPVALGYAILYRDGTVDLFMDQAKLGDDVRAHLGNEVGLRRPDEIGAALDALAGKSARLDVATVPAWIHDRLDSAKANIRRDGDPIILAKATKNAVELAGMRAAHRRDGLALVRFLSWLEGEVKHRTVREIEASDRLEAFRAEGEHFRDLSFPTISGAGPNGAIVHYRSTPATERALGPDSLYLLDSGAQYLDGTTDVTRTLAIGTPSAEMRDRYTRVLKGHIALARAIFPKGTTGAQLDVLARAPLWRAGVNYDHGTGHGVGSYLGVHEGPQRISSATPSQPLLAGMIISNEPGYYKTGGYGIRIENLVAVVPAKIDGAERDMLEFETLTLCPIDTRPIERSMLTDDERDWLDRYHASVRASLMPLVTDPATAAWLSDATAPL